MAESSEKQKHTYHVHTIGGEKLRIAASSYSINHAENRVYFADVNEDDEGQWEFFLTGVAAIHRLPPEKPMEGGVWSVSRQDY